MHDNPVLRQVDRVLCLLVDLLDEVDGVLDGLDLQLLNGTPIITIMTAPTMMTMMAYHCCVTHCQSAIRMYVHI